MVMRLLDMIGCLSAAMDLVSPAVVGHHRRVGFIAGQLGRVAGLAHREVADLTLAGLVHDVGAFSLQDRLLALAFDAEDRTHAEVGSRLLAGYPGLARVAGLVRRHHDSWAMVQADAQGDPAEGELANLLNLADRVDTQLPRAPGQPMDRQGIVNRLRQGAGRAFNPRHVEVFETLAGAPSFWRSLEAPCRPSLCDFITDDDNPGLELGEVRSLSRLFSQIIDFRSRFTATHSRGVAATAVTLGREMGMDDQALTWIELAGDLHDLGKLGVPSEIIMKPGPLTDTETTVMRRHSEYSHAALSGVPGFETVAGWVVNHHERLDGGGYPNHQRARELDLGSRVLAIADIFTALAEDRPYRPGMSLPDALRILETSVRQGGHDPDVTLALTRRLPLVDEARRLAQDEARANFQRFTCKSRRPETSPVH